MDDKKLIKLLSIMLMICGVLLVANGIIGLIK